jgi:8-oxo-dGTP pyrophosphatase MutT (NUDIX family)
LDGKRDIAVTLECYIRKDGKYLMLHRNPSKRIMPDVWMAPGGHLEFNEGLFECAKREVKEETNLEIKDLKVKAVGTAYLKDLNQELFFHFVTADYASGDLLEHPNDGTFAWLTLDEILRLPNLLAELKEVLMFVLDGTDGVISYKAVYEKGNEMSSFTLERP